MKVNKYPFVLVVIINYNGYENTVECLESIRRITYPNYKVVVIDNASRNDEISDLKRSFPEHTYILSKKNIGFSGANNLGIQFGQQAGAELFLFLNNDTIVTKDFLEPLVQPFITMDEVGVTTPQIAYYHSRDTLWMAGGALSKIRGSGYGYKAGSRVTMSTDLEDITFASGCCILIPSAVISTIGSWREDFFLYVEDVELSLRVMKAGYKIYLVNESIIYHKVNASMQLQTNNLPLYYMIRNKLYLSLIYFDIYSVFAIAYITVSTCAKMMLWLLFDRKKFHAAFEALYDFSRGRFGEKR